MTKPEFLAHVAALYRVGNYSDSDSPQREVWTVPAMAGLACCQHLDAMLWTMKREGVLTQDEIQEFHDTL